ncbi:MAG TPA: DUF5717 family protein [Lachnospiraceae bacterium]|nr:DUF5717 family protein [Lachnospiraceae bacterium]
MIFYEGGVSTVEEVIDRLLEGNFEYENGSLDFSYSKLELNIKQGKKQEGSFQILGEDEKYIRGYVISSDERMECLTKEFVGKEEEIFYCFHGEKLEEGDTVKGEFYVISNQGEYYLPFVVNVEYTVLSSSLGNIKNLFHFANLAKTSAQEAVKLFYSKDLNQIFVGSDRQYYQYYLGLSAYSGNVQNVEEFLICISKKQKIEYLMDVEEITLEDPDKSCETSFTVTRNGWGYTSLFIETEGDFLSIHKKELNDDDFVGNTCRISVGILTEFVHDGNNFGKITLKGSGTDKCIPVIVRNRTASNLGRKNLVKKRLILQLMEFYQAFRIKKISASTWLKESNKLVEKMSAGDDKDITARLFQSQLLITEERYNEAQWILDHVADILDSKKTENTVQTAYYLYLTTLIHREEEYVNRITSQVDYIYKQNKDEWRIAWLLLYLSEEYNKSFSKKWMFLEEQFDRGCTSPVIYIEALLLLNLNPSLLIKLGQFEKQILLFGAKHEMINEDVLMQLIYLVQKEREYSTCLFRILDYCYQLKQDWHILMEICSLLIKGNKAGKEYIKWYKRGVEQELRITRLYEYYMMSVDTSTLEPLPKMVLMYFSYQNSLSYELAAYLYANVYRNRDGFPELYDTYRIKIEQFILEQILKKRINRDLAYLYKNLIIPQMLTPEIANALSELLFIHMVEIDRQDIRYVVVYEYALKQERMYPVSDGKAFVSLLSSDSRILFEDGFRNRYVASVPHNIEKLLLPGKLVKQIAPLTANNQNLNIYMCLFGREPAEVTAENESRFRYLLEEEEISDDVKKSISMQLIGYYYEHDRIRELDQYLDQIEADGLPLKERGEVMRYMVLRGKEEKVFTWLKEYGPYGIEPKVLVRLCNRMIGKNGWMENQILTQAVLYAFRHGKYDEQCLHYLTLYFRGMMKEYRDIWKAAVDFSVDTYELCEKMLIQMLFSGAFVGEKMDIFRSYIAGGAKQKVEEAFLSQCAYEYFVKDRLTESIIFHEMVSMFKRGEHLHMVCKLAFIKFFSENRKERTQEIDEILTNMIQEMLKNHIYLKMFMDYLDLPGVDLTQLADRTIVEYRANPKARAIMHYCVEHAEGEKSEYLTEEMQEVCGGVCFKDFVLFFGEQLQYYIMEEFDESEQLTESATIQKSDTANGNAEGKFNLVNDLSISNTLQDYETVDKLLEEYEYKEFMRNGLLKLI